MNIYNFDSEGFDPRDMAILDHDEPDVPTEPCDHVFDVSIGHYNLLDTYTCKKCEHKKYYQGGGVGWSELDRDGGIKRGELFVIAASTSTGKSKLKTGE